MRKSVENLQKIMGNVQTLKRAFKRLRKTGKVISHANISDFRIISERREFAIIRFDGYFTNYEMIYPYGTEICYYLKDDTSK
jgi:hypothetical protein